MSKKRILWLINHTTLRNFEVPLLEELGYEIYLPKVFPFDESNMSASIDYSYDSKLTISKEEIDILNKVNFYKYIPEEAKCIINKHFYIAIFPFFPDQFKEIVSKFSGILIFHGFGFADNTYTNVISLNLGYHFLEKIERVKHRFWFGQGYSNLSDVEGGIFKEKAIHLPLGLKDAYLNDKWKGKNNNIFFVCPRINSNDHFYNVYKKFKSDFKEFEFIIGGAQPIKVNDKRVLGYVDRETYDDLFLNSKVMFYHSQYKTHIHYHPIEAIRLGMPLIFMSGGMLDELGGKNLPGRCKTINEAKRKIRKIISNDRGFIEKVRKSQEILLKQFTYDYCIDIWKENLKIIEETSIIKEEQGIKKIAVILPNPENDNNLEYAKLLAKCIKRGIDSTNLNIELVFAYTKVNQFRVNEFKELVDQGIKTREFYWENITSERLHKIQMLRGYDVLNIENSYNLPNDNINYFLDCDFWIMTTDRVDIPIAPLKPYIVCVHNYMQRYIPNLFGEYYEYSSIKLVRKAECVLVNSPQVYQDCIQYAGIRKDKIETIPVMFEMEEIKNDINFSKQTKKILDNDFFVWTTDTSLNQNHINCLEALLRYYNNGGKFFCYVVGKDTDLFDIGKRKNIEQVQVNTEVLKVREFLRKNPFLMEKIKFLGELQRIEYIQILTNAKMHLHNVIIDNISIDVINAAILGVPSLCSNYNSIKYLDSVFGLNCRFFDTYDEVQLSKLIMQGESEHTYWKKELPNKNEMLKFSIEKSYLNIWNSIRKIMMI